MDGVLISQELQESRNTAHVLLRTKQHEINSDIPMYVDSLSLTELHERLQMHYSQLEKAKQKIAPWDTDEIEEDLLNLIERKQDEAVHAEHAEWLASAEGIEEMRRSL
jgi:hypothetical protein